MSPKLFNIIPIRLRSAIYLVLNALSGDLHMKLFTPNVGQYQEYARKHQTGKYNITVVIKTLENVERVLESI